ncbi:MULTISPECIES: hypothetical protein [unclassified Plantactinospora]|uniref:hypothetical protein n=1 Tax=unclassified Plantactinospora TaxID=2631981 RepID=UPI000D170326|nr:MULTISPECIES: hypothetical protein [unclassified Plantactinospora]AVT29703.1 hypothetical protein C6361_09605 [Plantactinospora sp. BC1]AVT36198.1 hypothetical protein C6W10_06665 [Plantactinospora sp. BB1]
MRRRMSGIWLALPVLGLALAGCAGADEGPGVATAQGGTGAGPTASASAAALSDEDRRLEFAKCMRENGVEMPDPEPGQGGIRIQRNPGDDPAKTQAAMEKCRHLLPNGGQLQLNPEQVEQVRKMAKCMRENGVPNFPDPQPDGTMRFDQGSGIKRDDPTFQAAMEKCRGDFPVRIQGGGR